MMFCGLVLLLLWFLPAIIAAATPGLVCATLDWWPPSKCNRAWCPWHNSSIWAIDLEELVPYAKRLAPFLLRVGGSLQDQVVFIREGVCPFEQFASKGNGQYGPGCITARRLDQVSDFCRTVGCQLVWGLNGMMGRETNSSASWNSTNSEQILRYFHDTQAPLHAVTLGNEIWDEMVKLSIDQAVESFAELDRLVTEIWGTSHRPLIGGFDGNKLYDKEYFPRLLRRLSQAHVRLDVLNYHMYPLGWSVDDNVLKKALTPNKYLPYIAGVANKLVTYYSEDLQIWVSESGGSYDSGSPDATGSYASGFWYLDALATAHFASHQSWCRQTLAGGNYGLLDQMSPRRAHPDYWNALLYQKLLGKPLVQIHREQSSLGTCTCESNNNETVAHWYVYCAKSQTSRLAVLGINYSRKDKCTFQFSSENDLNVEVLELSPKEGNITSTVTQLNGIPLVVKEDGTFPSLEGKHIQSNAITLEPLSYGFFAIQGLFGSDFDCFSSNM